MVFGPFHYCASCERAAPDAPETIDDQRRCARCRYRTFYGGSRGSASRAREAARSYHSYSVYQIVVAASPW
jgi:DNA-directed RNA polymerase subunit RPC12/RpoP